MKLHEQLKCARKATGLSQEAAAALLGVSHQAVGNWESGRSAPSTENFLRLCELYGVSPADLCRGETLSSFPEQSIKKDGPAVSSIFSPPPVKCRRRIQTRLCCAAVIFSGYAAIYLFCRLIWVPFAEYSFFGWLFSSDASREVGYLYGWLCDQGFFLYSMLFPVILAIVGFWRCGVFSLLGFALGILLGELLGPNPSGAAMGAGHYGWLIWGAVFLLSLLAGFLVEWSMRRSKHKHPN